MRNDLVRGVIATDALIGTFARLDDPSLLQNICFLYHVLGGGTGDWDVPVGGMGSVTAALAAAARRLMGPKSSPAQRFTPSIRTARCATAAATTSTWSGAGSSWPASHRRSWPACSANSRRHRHRARRSR